VDLQNRVSRPPSATVFDSCLGFCLDFGHWYELHFLFSGLFNSKTYQDILTWEPEGMGLGEASLDHSSKNFKETGWDLDILLKRLSKRKGKSSIWILASWPLKSRLTSRFCSEDSCRWVQTGENLASGQNGLQGELIAPGKLDWLSLAHATPTSLGNELNWETV
jgi:hypothetical protein